MGLYNTVDETFKLNEMAIVFLLVLFIIGLVIYLAQAFFLNAYNKHLTKKNTWLAWIPITNIYLLGKLIYGNILGWGLAILSIYVYGFNNNLTTLFSLVIIGCYVYAIVKFIKLKNEDKEEALPKMMAPQSNNKFEKKYKGISPENNIKTPSSINKMTNQESSQIKEEPQQQEYQSQPAMCAPTIASENNIGFNPRPTVKNNSNSGSLQDFYRR